MTGTSYPVPPQVYLPHTKLSAEIGDHPPKNHNVLENYKDKELLEFITTAEHHATTPDLKKELFAENDDYMLF